MSWVFGSVNADEIELLVLSIVFDYFSRCE